MLSPLSLPRRLLARRTALLCLMFSLPLISGASADSAPPSAGGAGGDVIPDGGHPFAATVTFPGATLVGGVAEVLTGQQVTALMTLNPLPTNPDDPITYTWTVTGNTGINPYKDYDTTAPNSTNSTQIVKLTDKDYALSGVNFYDETNDETLTWKCTATFPNTPGAAPQSAFGSVTFMKPTVTAWGVNTGTGVQTGVVVRRRTGECKLQHLR